MRRRRMPRDDVEHFLTVFLTAPRRQRVAEHDLRLGVVLPLAENEAAALARIVERPSRQRAPTAITSFCV